MLDSQAPGAAPTGAEAAGERTIQRDDVVELFGTPDHTTGSVNEPRLQVENGFEFNEKWIYERPLREPTRPQARMIYWQRYDFVGCVRVEQDGRVVPESASNLLQRRGRGSH